MAKVLDQLSVAAWLPAFMLVGNAAVLFQLHGQQNTDVGRALGALVDGPFGVLIALVFAVVLATMVAQAFSYEGIRLLEGYWGRSRLTSWLIMWRTSRNRNRQKRLHKRREKYQKRAFYIAKQVMLEKNVKRTIIEFHEDTVLERTMDPRRSDEDIEEAGQPGNDWILYCPPSWIRRMEALDDRLREYPEPHRLLPTRLGNTIRSAEDQLTNEIAQRDLVNLILRNYDRISPMLRNQHHQFRTRLDMYCILTFVFVALAALAVALLGGLLPRLIAATGYGVLAWISYLAAVTSGRGYGNLLKVIDDQLVGDGHV
jgi:hypothetical protein